MVRSSKKPGNNSRNKSTVMAAMALLEGKFLPSRWLYPPTFAYETFNCSGNCVTFVFTPASIEQLERKGNLVERDEVGCWLLLLVVAVGCWLLVVGCCVPIFLPAIFLPYIFPPAL